MATKKKSKKEDSFDFKHKDIVLQSMLPKRLQISLGVHVEYYVDNEVVKKMLELMKEARSQEDDIGFNRLKVEYSSNEEHKNDQWCTVHFGDFSICRLSEKEFVNLMKGFEEFFEWSESYKIFDTFIHRVK
jgi:hypothetical protein